MLEDAIKKLDKLNKAQLEEYIDKMKNKINLAENRFLFGYAMLRLNRLDLAYDYLKEFIENKDSTISLSKKYDLIPDGCGGFTLVESDGAACDGLCGCCICLLPVFMTKNIGLPDECCMWVYAPCKWLCCNPCIDFLQGNP
ncbi:MAG TPA: hypothetical protein IAA26_05405 [Candidatus Blautia faecipullorum]|nr:hypothetical protein [Candidatus Blautia faecipullorum]